MDYVVDAGEAEQQINTAACGPRGSRREAQLRLWGAEATLCT